MKKIIIAFFVFLSSTLCSELTTVINNYIAEIDRYQKESKEEKKQIHRGKAREYAEVLLGVVPNVKICTYNNIKEFCTLLENKIPELQKLCTTKDKKTTLKAKRDISNYTEIVKFLKSCSKFIDAIYQFSGIIDLILEKCPREVPFLAKEIAIMLRILEMVIASSKDIETPIAKMRDFASSEEDGTYLLSSLISLAMHDFENADFKEILSRTDFSDPDVRIYLKIR
jgi:hypothetical protein